MHRCSAGGCPRQQRRPRAGGCKQQAMQAVVLQRGAGAAARAALRQQGRCGVLAVLLLAAAWHTLNVPRHQHLALQAPRWSRTCSPTACRTPSSLALLRTAASGLVTPSRSCRPCRCVRVLKHPPCMHVRCVGLPCHAGPLLQDAASCTRTPAVLLAHTRPAHTHTHTHTHTRTHRAAPSCGTRSGWSSRSSQCAATS
jgi:hypothetical protein